MSSEEYDEAIANMNMICKDDGMFERMAYAFIKSLVDRFDITPDEAGQFWIEASTAAYEFALNGGESET